VLAVIRQRLGYEDLIGTTVAKVWGVLFDEVGRERFVSRCAIMFRCASADLGSLCGGVDDDPPRLTAGSPWSSQVEVWSL
jgi:hypothetical protein